LGIGYIRNGEYERAKEKLTRALEIDSDSAEAHNAFGLLFQVQGEYVIAEESYKRAIRLDKEFTQARNNYGAFLFEQQRYKAAIKQLEKASEDTLYRLRSQVFENLGRCYLKTGNLVRAEKALVRAVNLNPRQPRALLELSEIQFDRRDFVTSENYFGRYLQVSRHNARSLWLGIRLARVFSKQDDEASYSLMLKNIFPASDEFKQYEATMP
jgi:type IV pilus assembly protein PilF